MRNLPPENQAKPLNEANLENLIEEFELTAQNNLSVIIDMSQRLNELAIQTRSMLHTLSHLQLMYSLEKDKKRPATQATPTPTPSGPPGNPGGTDTGTDTGTDREINPDHVPF